MTPSELFFKMKFFILAIFERSIWGRVPDRILCIYSLNDMPPRNFPTSIFLNCWHSLAKNFRGRKASLKYFCSWAKGATIFSSLRNISSIDKFLSPAKIFSRLALRSCQLYSSELPQGDKSCRFSGAKRPKTAPKAPFKEIIVIFRKNCYLKMQ